MAAGRIDAFILYNERETAVGSIVQDLESRGISTHFWRRDVEFGEKVDETPQLENARAVVVFLGDQGWGPNHLRITEEAQKREKRLIPVLIGNPPDTAFNDAGGLFRDHRYLDMRSLDQASHDALAKSIQAQQPVREDRIDRIVNVLLNGSDEQRAEMLEEIETSRTLDRPALAARLRSLPDQPTAVLVALIWSDAESLESRDLILGRMKAAQPGRFEMLRNLFKRKASYLDKAVEIARESPYADGVLAKAIQIWSTGNPELLEEFRSRLHAEEIESGIQIAALLNDVPIPALAADVWDLSHRFPGTLYGLTHPEMARAAAEVVSRNPGVGAAVEHILEVAGKEPGRSQKLAVVLAGLDRTQVDQALQAARQNPEMRVAADFQRDCLKRIRNPNAAGNPFVPEVASDTIDINDDRLGIREDVHTLTAVMLSKQLKPPLGIGLFGDWGSGKSFFMQSMRAASDEFAKRAKKSDGSKFCTDVVSIWFNAWNYVDTNLWASLVSHILEELAQHVSPAETPEKKQAALMAELNSAKAIAAESEVQKKVATDQVADREKELGKLQTRRQEKEIELRDLQAADLWALVDETTVPAAELKQTLQSIGVPETLNSVSDFRKLASEAYTVKGRLTALFVALINGKDRRVFWTLLVVALVVIPAGYYGVRYLTSGNDALARATLILSEITAFFVGAKTVLRKALDETRKRISQVETAKQKVEARIAEKRKNPTEDEKKLQGEIALLKVQEKEAESRITAAAARVRELEDRIQALQQGRSLAWFLAERTRSEDYRKHLGLISTIRKDFHTLSERLQNPDADSKLLRVERIVLYIDDLDRCPAEKVLDVLQAVHLLLAYPLFVVVVGVDQRWLLHSLETSFSAFRSAGESASGDRKEWVTTPQNYLEKIFQIPFNLRPMSTGGYAQLMDYLLLPPQPNKPKQEVPVKAQPAPTPATKSTPSGEPAAKAAPVEQPARVEREEKKEEKAPELETLEINEDSLVIQDWESKFAARLFELIPTPRAAKRFSNTYRILKAPLRHNSLSEFEGTAKELGAFQVPMVLLAISIGAPAEAADLFPKLLQAAISGQNPTEKLRRMAGFASLQDKLQPILSDPSFPADPEAYLEWIPRVSRFSFEAGRAIRRQETAAASA